MLRLEVAEREQTTAALFMPLEMVGGAGDVMLLGRALSKGQDVINPFRAGSSGRAVNPMSPLAHIRTRDTLVNQFKDFDPATDEMRRAWIALARGENGGAKRFLDMENGMLKRLNDLGDKDAITALTNVHKKLIMDGIADLQRRYPGLEINMYSDFKSMRFAFNGEIPPNLDAEMTAMFTAVGSQITDLVTDLRNTGGLQLPATENPSTWFAGGFGETADQAGIASREARCRNGELCNFPLRDYAQPALRQALADAAVSLENTRNVIGNRLKNMRG